MSSVLYALGRWAFRARVRVLVLWGVVLIVAFAAAGLLGQGTDNTYRIPGTESQDALDALARTFPQISGASAQLVAVAPPGESVLDAAFESAVEASVADIGTIAQVSSVGSPYDSASGVASDDSAVLVPIQLAVTTTSVLPSTSAALQDAGTQLASALPAGSQVAVGGQLFAQGDAGISITELLGIAVAFFVLLLTFASLVAAGLPLMTALVGVGVALSLVLAATRFTTITSTTPLLALMLGLAVGIDYALFILARHQEQLKQGLDPEEAAARSIATSGSAIVFAALTVVIALLGLTIAGIPFLTTMGLAAALAVVLAVVVALTLTPALLGFAGWRVVSRRFRPGQEAPPVPHEAVDPDLEAVDPEEEAIDEAAAPPRGFFAGWFRAATRWPAVTLVLVVAALALAAVPAAHLRLALPDTGSMEESAPARIAYDLIAEHFGPGYNGPLLVTGSIIESDDPVGLMDDLATDIAAVDGVASVPLSTPNQSADTGVVQVIPDGAPDSVETAAVVAELRAMHDAWEDEYGVSLSVTGYTAAGIDISVRLGGALLPFGIVVVGLSLVLLAMVFRSIVVPVTAALGYVLSIGAALGLTSLVFVDGVLAEQLNVADVGTVISFMPIILMGVLFGLAMDYEMFLVSRIREDYVHRGDARSAVRNGFLASARVVTAAATIMFAVFVAFVPEGDANIQPIAFGLAVGVVVDAFLVRMTLMPAVLVLFRDRAWRIPRVLDRLLPRLDVEGAALAEEIDLADWPGHDVALATDGLRVTEDSAPLDIDVQPGAVLVIEGGSPRARSAVLAALSGRGPIATGRAKVAGLALPARSASVRTRTALWDARERDPRGLDDALDGAPRVILIEGLDDIVDPARRAEIRQRLARLRRERPHVTVVVGTRSSGAVHDVLPVGAHIVTAELRESVEALA